MMLLDRHLELGNADARIVQDADGSMVSVETATDTLFGWPVEELRGARAPMMVHPDDREFVWKVRNVVRTTGSPQSAQIRVRAYGGRWLWVECAFSPVPDADGRFGGRTELLLRDISGRYLGDEALQLLVDLRSVVDTADTITDALRDALVRLARWGGFRAAVAWQPDGESWEPLVTATCTSECAELPTDDRRRDAIASVARTQRWTWVDGAGAPVGDDAVGGPDAEGMALLVPIMASQTTVAVVELVGATETAAGSAQLVIDVAQQLGDTIRRRRIESDLDLARRHFQLAFDEAAIGMALVAPDGTFIDANASLCRLLGRERDELATLGFQAVTHPADLEVDLELVRQTLAGERATYQLEKRYLRPDGTVIWGLLSVSLVRDEQGEPVNFISQIQDISQRKHAEGQLERTIEELARKERRYRSLIEPSVDMIVRIGVDGRVEDVNHRAAAAIDASRADLVGKHVSELVPSSLADSILDHVSHVSATGRPDEMWRQWLEPADRPPGWYVIRLMPEEPETDSGDVEHVHLMASEITELVENEQRLSAMALVDALTGLSNRAAVFDRLQHALDRLDRRPGAGIAVAVIDLDHFKAINDTFGHAAGDEALRAAASALTRAVRAEDTVGRLGGDEFIVVFEDVRDREMSGELGRRLHDELAATTVHVDADRSYTMSGSVGVAFTDTAIPMNDLVARADRAMYQAKRHGRGRSWTERECDGQEATASSSAMLRDLAAALSKDQFELHYQPIARAGDRRIVAFEALLRWRHPERGVVPPSQFLNALFSTGQIGPVGHWVIRTAIRQLATWRRDPATAHLHLHINISPAELAYPGFADILRAEFAAQSVDACRLHIEVTEQALAGSVVSSSAIAEIASTGVRLVLDDFGTGVSSLSNLRARPLHGIKIDRSFISGADVDGRERAIAESVIVLGNALDIDVTAEGVETAEQADWLEQAGCRYLQGWFIGHPEPVDVATELVVGRDVHH